jgi:hypothetical protein
MSFFNKLYSNGIFNPTLANNLYLGAMLREGAQKDKLNGWYMNFVEAQDPYEMSVSPKCNWTQQKLLYTPTLGLEKGHFRQIYNQNYSAWGHTFRFISAIPLALWDVTVCNVARIFVMALQDRAGDLQSQSYNWMSWYHLGKNFEMAWGRLCGMVNDAKGMEIVHRAYVDKRIYTLAWEQWPIVENKHSYQYSYEALQKSKSRQSVLNDFCIDCAWNVLNQKDIQEDEQFTKAEWWMVELFDVIEEEECTPYYLEQRKLISEKVNELEAGLKSSTRMTEILSINSQNIQDGDKNELLQLLGKKYDSYVGDIEDFLKEEVVEENKSYVKTMVCRSMGLPVETEDKAIRKRYKDLAKLIHPDKNEGPSKELATTIFNNYIKINELFEKYFPK